MKCFWCHYKSEKKLTCKNVSCKHKCWSIFCFKIVKISAEQCLSCVPYLKQMTKTSSLRLAKKHLTSFVLIARRKKVTSIKWNVFIASTRVRKNELTKKSLLSRKIHQFAASKLVIISVTFDNTAKTLFNLAIPLGRLNVTYLAGPFSAFLENLKFLAPPNFPEFVSNSSIFCKLVFQFGRKNPQKVEKTNFHKVILQANHAHISISRSMDPSDHNLAYASGVSVRTWLCARGQVVNVRFFHPTHSTRSSERTRHRTRHLCTWDHLISSKDSIMAAIPSFVKTKIE